MRARAVDCVKGGVGGEIIARAILYEIRRWHAECIVRVNVARAVSPAVLAAPRSGEVWPRYCAHRDVVLHQGVLATVRKVCAAYLDSCPQIPVHSVAVNGVRRDRTAIAVDRNTASIYGTATSVAVH